MEYDPIVRDDTPKSFINPISKAVSIEIFNEDNSKQTIVLPPYEYVTYPTYLANVLIKHLVDALVIERGYTKFVTEEARAELEKEIIAK